MRKLVYISLLPFLAILCLMAGRDVAAKSILLEAPEKVARGDAFLARASAGAPVDEFTFYWRGKKHFVKAEKQPDGQSAASILLPVPLEEKAGKLRLGVGEGKNGVEAVRTEISFFDKKRPVQKLKVDKKYVTPPASEKARIENDREKVRKALASSDPERKWVLPFTRPVQGSVSSQFGMKRVFNGQPRSSHKGLDLRGAEGTPVYACSDGRVALVDNLYYSGNTVYLDHGNGVFTAYLHLSRPEVKAGQIVAKGDLVGLVGSTGRVTGPHLHLSLIVQGQLVDPYPLLDEISGKGKK